jgi:hypothetical protein
MDLSRLANSFTRAWKALADEGLCDAWGGDEWARVVAEWTDAGFPLPAAAFILERANVGPSG